MKNQSVGILNNEKGTVLIMSTLALVALLGLAALSVDITHLTVVKNELQDAADAGALAGAAVLFNSDDTINGGADAGSADAVAVRVATSNMSDQQLIDETEVAATRGHWSFSDKTFTPNSTTDQVDWVNMTTQQLDTDTDYINAVQVVVTRNDIASFFAKVLGLSQFLSSADAVGYIGFAGVLEPHDVDQPIAICEGAIIDGGGDYTCNMGRMINSGQDELTGESGGWTSFEQNQEEDDGCIESGTNSNEIKPLVCGTGNPEPIEYGKAVAALGGQADTAFASLIDCWMANADTDGDGIPDDAWNLTLLVVDCGDANNMENCVKAVGAVNIDIIWINGNVNDQNLKVDDIPSQMKDSIKGDWSCTPQIPEGASPAEKQAAIKACWDDFADHFDLENVDGGTAPYQAKAIYFKPNCDVHIPKGGTSGNNYGIHAAYPVLVE